MFFLPETLQSVSAQTFQDYEIIIVNDGSSDDVESWITQITDPRVKLISQTNQGVSIARNTGIERSQAEYIAFLDADDLWEPTKLEKQVQLLDQNPEIGLVYNWVAMIDSQGNLIGQVRKSYVEGDVWEKLIEHNMLECSSTPIVRRCCFAAVGLFDPSISQGEDWELWLRIAVHYPFKVIPEPLTYYRDHANNSSKNWTVLAQDYYRVIDKIFAKAPANRQHLKSRSYSFANLRIAWKALQNLDGGCSIALRYRAKALADDPSIRYSKECLRLSLALLVVQFFGLNAYSQFRASVYRLKDTCLKFPKKLLAVSK
jgi:glycosyltransferase involved in cell wall biosynthesis